MADNLPLLPRKDVICGDVRPVLREVFREEDYLPPLATERTVTRTDEDDEQLPQQGQWIYKFSNECEKISSRERKLKHDHARRLSKEPLPNIYQLSSPVSGTEVSSWKLEHGIITRKDLVPSIKQDAGRDASLWVQNLLNRSSCDVSCMEVRGSHLHIPLQLPPAEDSMQSLSIGEVVVRRPPPPAPVPPPPPAPEYIVCVPPQLDFVNFTVGHLHTQTLRLINVSKFEIRLSIRPPSRRELDVMVCGPRGLTVSSGATAELRVRFKPRDVLALRDALLVRASAGRSLCVPLHCYMHPPILDVLVPNVTWSSLSCSPGEAAVHSGGDVLELGARLLGDVHCARLLLHCDAAHAAFFVLTEDAWITYCLDTLTRDGALIAGPFTISPAWWCGGGAVRGSVWCRAPHAGLHVTALRVLASTAVARPLHVLADALHFTPDHVTLEAQEKDYDICSEDDPACQYYVHLGTAFPNRGLAATVQLVNHSPVVYSYYWSVRPWGICSCLEDELVVEGSIMSGEDSDTLCVGALEAKAQQNEKDSPRAQAMTTARLTRVEPARGRVAPRSTCSLHVCVPDVGSELGTQRAVLMLILKDIPKESFPPDYDPMIVKTDTVISDPIPGQDPWALEVCEVICCQLEVWWEVVPVRFVLDPPILPLPHSRRVKEIQLVVRATQLFGCEGIHASWRVPPRVAAPHPPRLTSVHSTPAQLEVPLPVLPNEYPSTDVFVLEAANEEWSSQTTVIRQCATRHPRLRPARIWLGVVTPGAHMNTHIQVFNDTHQQICWWGTPFRWHGENVPSPWCEGRQVCEQCRERACSCALLRPARGALPQRAAAVLAYDVNAPDTDGCVATLIQVRRTLGDVARVADGAGSDARASLVAYRVLAPRVHLRALPCHGERRPEECERCNLDPGSQKSGGTAVLRPSKALALGRCTCYRLRLTNITPLPTTVRWEPPIEKEDVLKVTFLPNDFDVGSYSQVEILVVIEALKVCGRRIFVYCARVANAYKPLYLLIDTAVAGLEVLCEMPLGGESHTSASVIMRRTQREVFPWEEPQERGTPEEMFAREDRKRAERADNTCHCKYKMVYIPPVKPLRPPPQTEDDLPDIEILWEPPPLTRVCPCDERTKPILPEYQDPLCLQFKNMPLKTVRTRLLKLTNLSVLAGRWSATVRNWPRHRNRTINNDAWSVDVKDPGLCVEVSPSNGVLGAAAQIDVSVSVYADCWGLYRDQILIHIEKLEPLVVDLWVEAVGAPLQFSINRQVDEMTTLWMSSSDPERVVRFKNTTRTDLVIHAYVLSEHVHSQDVLPFRMYLRFFDVLPRFCPCVTAFDSVECLGEGSEKSCESTKAGSESVLPEDMDTGVELFFTADYGAQDEGVCFKVEPTVSMIEAGAFAELKVTLDAPDHGEMAPNAVLLLRALPVQNTGPGWFRSEQAPQLLRLEQTQREGLLRASHRQLRVRLCALDLPYGDVMRIRKTFQVKNIGNGPLCVTASTVYPWSIVAVGHSRACVADCGCARTEGERAQAVPLYLMPRSSTEMIVELCINTAEAWPGCNESSPCAPPKYKELKRTSTPLHFYDDDNVLLTVSLMMDLEFPIIRLEPAAIDFGFVTDGDTRKTYFTVAHTSRIMTLDLVAEWVGDSKFALWPQRLRIPPGGSERVYVQYISRWRAGPAEGCARVSYGLRGGGACGGGGGTGGADYNASAGAGAGAGAWCRAVLPVRAAPTRDFKWHDSLHDHTDDQAPVAWSRLHVTRTDTNS